MELARGVFAAAFLSGSLCVDCSVLSLQSQQGPPYGHPSPNKNYTEHTNFTLWLVEEFDTPLNLLTDDIWTYSDGGLAEGRTRFVKEGIKFESGSMILEAAETTAVQSNCSHAEAGPVFCKPLTSGEMRTKHNMFRYGRYETRMKAPKADPRNVETDGSYVATMFVYKDGKFRHWREIDVEVLGDGQLFTNVLYAENTTWYRDNMAASGTHQVGPVRDDFHEYAFEWLPTSVTWYFDGQEVRKFTGNDLVKIPDMAGKIMMSLWIWIDDEYHFGGKDGANNVYPLRVEYDWFRFYKWNDEITYPCTDMTNQCLSEDDRYLAGNNPCDNIMQEGDALRQSCTATCPYTEDYSKDDDDLCKSQDERDGGGDGGQRWIWLTLGVSLFLCTVVGLVAGHAIRQSGEQQEGVQLA